MSIEKIAKIVKRRGKYCVQSHKKDKNGRYKNFGCYSDRKSAEKRLGQIFMFKAKKALLLNIMTVAAERLENKGIIHLADVIDYCAEEVAADTANENTAIKLMKVVNLLEKKSEFELAEQIDSVIPEIFDKSCEGIEK